MRQVRNTQLEFGKVRIEDIEVNLKSRDDIVAKGGFLVNTSCNIPPLHFTV